MPDAPTHAPCSGSRGIGLDTETWQPGEYPTDAAATPAKPIELQKRHFIARYSPAESALSSTVLSEVLFACKD